MERPSGTVTFLFTDIEGSTRLWDEHPGEMAGVLADHDRLVREAVEGRGGRVFSTAGDAFAAVFPSALAAVEAAIAAQSVTGSLVAGGQRVRVRMAVHTGEVEERDGGFFGPVLNRCARLRDAAHGGQILVSLAAQLLLADRLPEGITLLDVGEHRLRDLARPERVFQLCHPDLESEFGPLRSLAGLSTNLPIQVTSFVGRVQESAELEKLIRGSRLVTVTGAGGCGKSRLAVQVAADMLDEFPDGVWLVELASLSDPELLVSTVATELGVREQPGVPPVEALTGYLRHKQSLLVVDNCEHLIEPVAEMVAHLLSHTEGVRVVATSREPLHIRGETVYHLPTLPVPESDDDWDTLVRVDSVRLFAERADAAHPGFRVTHDNAPAVASICTHLDGIPLAVELAAAATRMMNPDQIDDRLGDRFRLLTGGARDDVDHHRTLQAAIDWSHQLLAPDQQALFARLAVFEGGWTLEAAEQVCDGEPLATSDIMPLLADLVDRSLVVLRNDDSGVRYRYLESIRAYAADQSGGDDRRQQHALYYLNLAERLEPLVTTDRQHEVVALLSTELADLRAALEALADSGRSSEYCRLLMAVWRFLWFRRLYRDIDRYFEQAVAMLDDLDDRSLQGQILMAAGWNVTRGQGIDRDEAIDLILRSVPLLEDDPLHLSEALSYLGSYADVSYFDAAIDAAARSGNPTAMARPHHYLGISAFWRGDYQTAIEHLEKAGTGFESPNHKGFALAWLATVLYRVGRLDRASTLAEQARGLFAAIQDPGGLCTSLEQLAVVRLYLGEAETAYQAALRCVELQTDMEGEAGRGIHAVAAHAAVQLGDDEAALQHLTSARQAVDTGLLNVDHQTHAFIAVAVLALRRNDPRTAVLALAAESIHRPVRRLSAPELSGPAVMPNKPREQHLCDLKDQTRRLLPPDQFDTAWQQGTTLTVDDIIDYALNLIDTTAAE